MIRHASPRSQRQGFTLIELLVVLAIVGIVSSITLGGFREMTQGNKRISCQTNLNQIYQAARLYAADSDGRFPYYVSNLPDQEVDCAVPDNNQGIGLWALYTFPDPTFKKPATVESAPIEVYLRSAKVLHCPSDYSFDSSNYSNRNLYSADKTRYNPEYLSYQACDDVNKTPLNFSDDVSPYSLTRTNNTTDTDWKRQLLHYKNTTFVKRLPDGDTVVTWCQFHRRHRDMDIVLFYDGTVQLMPRIYDDKTGWQRKPKPPG